MKQKKHQKRIAVRLPSEQRQQIEKLVNSGRFRNLSEVIRVALKQFFEREGID
jgi:Arc/MetJ-type ribon-helix-helix transcriptional regulator